MSYFDCPVHVNDTAPTYQPTSYPTDVFGDNSINELHITGPIAGYIAVTALYFLLYPCVFPLFFGCLFGFYVPHVRKQLCLSAETMYTIEQMPDIKERRRGCKEDNRKYGGMCSTSTVTSDGDCEKQSADLSEEETTKTTTTAAAAVTTYLPREVIANSIRINRSKDNDSCCSCKNLETPDIFYLESLRTKVTFYNVDSSSQLQRINTGWLSINKDLLFYILNNHSEFSGMGADTHHPYPRISKRINWMTMHLISYTLYLALLGWKATGTDAGGGFNIYLIRFGCMVTAFVVDQFNSLLYLAIPLTLPEFVLIPIKILRIIYFAAVAIFVTWWFVLMPVFFVICDEWSLSKLLQKTLFNYYVNCQLFPSLLQLVLIALLFQETRWFKITVCGIPLFEVGRYFFEHDEIHQYHDTKCGGVVLLRALIVIRWRYKPKPACSNSSSSSSNDSGGGSFDENGQLTNKKDSILDRTDSTGSGISLNPLISTPSAVGKTTTTATAAASSSNNNTTSRVGVVMSVQQPPPNKRIGVVLNVANA